MDVRKTAIMYDAMKGLFALLGELLSDVRRCGDALDSGGLDAEEEEFWLRMYVRSTLALIEGLAYRLKQIAHAAHETGTLTFSSKELSYMKEESRLAFMANIEFAFKAAASAIDSGYRLPVHDDGWALLSRAAKIRNRLMHPKSTEDLLVRVDEVHIVGKALSWFGEQVGDLFFGKKKPMTEEMRTLYRQWRQVCGDSMKVS